MVVITGPFDFFTTFKSGDTWVPGGGVEPTCAALACTEQPVITAAAPIAALRIRKARRSTPAGASGSSISINVRSSVFLGIIRFLPHNQTFVRVGHRRQCRSHHRESRDTPHIQVISKHGRLLLWIFV